MRYAVFVTSAVVGLACADGISPEVSTIHRTYRADGCSSVEPCRFMDLDVSNTHHSYYVASAVIQLNDDRTMELTISGAHYMNQISPRSSTGFLSWEAASSGTYEIGGNSILLHLGTPLEGRTELTLTAQTSMPEKVSWHWTGPESAALTALPGGPSVTMR